MLQVVIIDEQHGRLFRLVQSVKHPLPESLGFECRTTETQENDRFEVVERIAILCSSRESAADLMFKQHPLFKYGPQVIADDSHENVEQACDLVRRQPHVAIDEPGFDLPVADRLFSYRYISSVFHDLFFIRIINVQYRFKLYHENVRIFLKPVFKGLKLSLDAIFILLSYMFKGRVPVVPHHSGYTLHRHPVGIGDGTGERILRNRTVQFLGKPILLT